MQTGSKERADRVARQLRAGAVHVNGAGYSTMHHLVDTNNQVMAEKVE